MWRYSHWQKIVWQCFCWQRTLYSRYESQEQTYPFIRAGLIPLQQKNSNAGTNCNSMEAFPIRNVPYPEMRHRHCMNAVGFAPVLIFPARVYIDFPAKHRRAIPFLDLRGCIGPVGRCSTGLVCHPGVRSFDKIAWGMSFEWEGWPFDLVLPLLLWSVWHPVCAD